MSTEDDLRRRLHDELTARDTASGGTAIDTARVIDRARRRRRPRRLALGATLGAAVVGIGIAGVAAGGSALFGVADDTASSAGGWRDESTTFGDFVPDSTDCGSILSPVDPASAAALPPGLRLDPDGPVSFTSADSVSGAAILTNTADSEIDGGIWSVSVVVLRDDAVIGVAHDDSGPSGDDLDVGQSVGIELQSQLVVCPGTDESAPLGSPNDTVAWVVDVVSNSATPFDSGGRPPTPEREAGEPGPLVVRAESRLLD